jgi:hypothetical protein
MESLSTFSTDNLLASISPSLRNELITTYNQIITNYREGRWEPSELNGGKLCEVVYTILRSYVDGTSPVRSAKPPNMVMACHELESVSGTFPRSVKIQIPRMLIALYEVRNNRGVGHVGGEVNPNHMDATCVLYMSKWIVSELVRLFHNVDIETAEITIEAIVERMLPTIWKVGEKLRVLDVTTTMKEKTLLILYNSTTPLREQYLFNCVEHSNSSTYRRDILRSLHSDKLVEYDASTKVVHLSPTGVIYVERTILPNVRPC